ncbi:helix-turn-helix domain-containing protein [Zavarzinia aquatilis]|nr:XRE family transcriptional regulator [Zavarzinia aquatilis]
MHISERQAPVLGHLAANLKRLRQHAGLSQDALAKASGVSRRMLVAMESGDSNVSLSTLDRIAAALGVMLPDLIVDREAAAHSPVLAWQGASGASQAHLLQSAPASRLAELWQWRLAPGERYRSEAAPGDWWEMVFVLDGRLTIALPGGTVVLAAGQSHAYRADGAFDFVNEGDTPLRFLRNVVI